MHLVPGLTARALVAGAACMRVLKEIVKIRPRDHGMGYQGMRSSKSKLKASVYWWTRGQF